MKYRSEIIKEIVDNRGHKKSSLHYESECVESWIKETKGSYPKLMDYESEWLNYMEENHIGMFPYMTLSDVTNATVENVVPYAYKSAILKGQTLVNLAKVRSATTYNVCSEKNIVIKPNTKYIAMFNPTYGEGTGRINYALLLVSSVSLSNSVESGDDAYSQSISGGKGSEYAVQKGDRYLIFTSKDNESYIHIRTGGEVGVAYTDMIILEYQEGMENWDIPYFEGMQSVKMPVLRTSNEDGTKTNILSTSEDVVLRGIGDVKDTLDLITGEVTERVGEVILNGSENWIINNISDTTINLYCNGFGSKSTSLVMCDKLKSERYDGIRTSTVGGFSVTLDRNITGIDNMNTFKNWLQNNNLTVAYPLETEVIKTVDLTVVNQDGETLNVIKPIEGTMHLSTSADNIKPTFSGEIPVEAIAQNLASFIEE